MEKIAFQIDPIELLKIQTDSSLVLMAESIKRGYSTYCFQPENLFYENGKVLAKVKLYDYSKNHHEEIMDLAEFKISFIRQDPPFNMRYLTTTYLLEKIADRVMVVNNPRSIRDNPEKLFCLDFKNFIPKTCITDDIEIAGNFLNQLDRIVIKPLYAFGGNDIFLIDKKNFKDKFAFLLAKYQDKVILQEFIPAVKFGDKRVLMVKGEPVATILRVPEAGGFIANIAQGGKAYKTELTSKELDICNQVGIKLQEKDIIFAGIDLIGGYLTEINITSPTMIIAANNLYGEKIEELIFNALK